MTHTAPPAATERFAGLIDGLCRAVAASLGRNGVTGPLILLIWSRLRRLAAQFAALAARIESGRQRRYPARRSPRPAPRRHVPPALPHTPAWLSALMPQARGYASQLQYLLADPQMAALIEAAPQAGRILRPLCRMLGVGLTPNLLRRRPAPPAAPARPAASGRAPPPAARPAPPPPHPPARAAAPAPAPDPRACGPAVRA